MQLIINLSNMASRLTCDQECLHLDVTKVLSSKNFVPQIPFLFLCSLPLWITSLFAQSSAPKKEKWIQIWFTLSVTNPLMNQSSSTRLTFFLTSFLTFSSHESSYFMYILLLMCIIAIASQIISLFPMYFFSSLSPK